MKLQESERTEFKSIVVTDIKKEIIAFANCDGGKIYIGIEDDGTVIGVEDSDSVALQVSNMVRDAIKPDLTMFLHYETKEIEQKQVVIIDIQRGTERPYYIAKKGLRPEGVYVRQGYSSVPATDTAIRKMIKETDGDHFEDMRSLDQELTFCETKKEFQKRNITLEQPQMKTLGIINKDGIYTNLALLLSDQCVHTIKTAVFEGKNQNIFKDRKEFTGSLFAQMEAVYDYIDFRNQTHSIFEKLYRIDNRDYPEVAVREALLNCLVHRDYGYSSSILISMYEDRLEFTSIGGLVTGVTLEDVMMGISVCRNKRLANVFYRLEFTSIGGLVTGVTLEDVMMGISVCRNKRLANVFYRLELIEAYGTGIQKIMNAYQDQFIKPEIKVSNNVFKIILPNTNAQAELREELQYHTHIQPEDEETQIMQMIDQEKKNSKKTSSGKIRNQSDNEWKDFEADG